MNADVEVDGKPGLLPRFTLKDGDSFLLADALGDIQGPSDGLYTNDTRVLSRFELAIAGRRPSLLGAAVSQNNTLFTTHLTNRPLAATGEYSLPQGTIHIERGRLLWNGRLYERIRLTNFSDQDTEVPLELIFAADFADIFEVQGHHRSQRGLQLPPQVDGSRARLSYRGRDDIVRTTDLAFTPVPDELSQHRAAFRIPIARGATATLHLEIGDIASERPSSERFDSAAGALAGSMQERLDQGATVHASARLFNQWIERSRSDLALLTTSLATGPYPYAGIPWFATQFGRDAIITALQTLWINPALAAGVLRFLASTQAHDASSFRDSEPGKIMHETRRGEMAVLGEVPFGQYYGGVDTTPLFVMLAGAYEERVGDGAVVDEIWDELMRAAAWIERRLASSRTGFLDYAPGEDSGLKNQAWKDSRDSMFHADGRFPQGPVAVVEVQGYACAAFAALARLSERRGANEAARRWHTRARELREAIEARFWVPRMNYYAIALDGESSPCEVYGSNAGHLLFCGVVLKDRAASVSSALLSDRFCSGWGIRTLAEGEARYNPMSYHNGSIWPHDTAICAAGIARYGSRWSTAQLLGDMFETAVHFNLRLPELFCGFPRMAGQGPAPYPVACLPQAWASGAVFLMLQASLGIEIDAYRKQVHVTRPALPEGVESVTVRELEVCNSTIDLVIRQVNGQVVVAPTKQLDPEIEVVVNL